MGMVYHICLCLTKAINFKLKVQLDILQLHCKTSSLFNFFSMPQWRLYTKLTKEYNINGVQRLSVYVYNIEEYFRSALIKLVVINSPVTS
jgi:hypothetical protein